MTSFAYPRLPDSEALVRAHQMRTMVKTDPRQLGSYAAAEHPATTPVPTGATIATRERIISVRSTVTSAVARWLTGAPVPRGEASAFDIILGRALHESLQILPADAAHQETWNFLSTVLLPDVVWARFPDLHENRVLGKPRNTLRRAWHRHDVIGDLQAAASRPLGEDELTGIFERTALASNRPLARALAEAVLRSEAANRSQFARDLYRGVTELTGPLLLDVLSEDEITQLVARTVAGEPWPDIEPLDAALAVDSVGVEASPAESPTLRQSSARHRVPGDLVREFHRDMLAVARESGDVLGYAPTALLRIIDDLGGVEAARRIVGADTVSTAFVAQWEHNRLDLSVEHLLLDPEYEGLFSEQLVGRARHRLREHGMTAPR